MIPTLTVASLSGLNEIQVKGFNNSRVWYMMETILRNCPKRVLVSVGTSLWVLWFDLKFNQYKQNCEWHLGIDVSCLLLWICSAQTLVGPFFSSQWSYCFLLCWKERGWEVSSAQLSSRTGQVAFAVLRMLLMTWVPGVMILTFLPMAYGNCREEGKGGHFLHESHLWTRCFARRFPAMTMAPEVSIDLPSQRGRTRGAQIICLRSDSEEEVESALKSWSWWGQSHELSIRWGPGSISPEVSGLDTGSFSRVGVI